MIYISENAGSDLKEYLLIRDEVHIVHSTELVYPQIASHADIYMCRLGDEVIHAKADELGYSYPDNIAFNAACTGRYFIHNTAFTSERLLESAKTKGMHIINVKQGYTKCNTAIIDETSVITSDRGIFKAVSQKLDALLISTGHILLKGFDYGFIGGACGRVGDEIIFNGNISAHPDYNEIRAFIEKRGLNIKYFDYPLEDIGSII